MNAPLVPRFKPAVSRGQSDHRTAKIRLIQFQSDYLLSPDRRFIASKHEPHHLPQGYHSST
jgi:hypothetical protein